MVAGRLTDLLSWLKSQSRIILQIDASMLDVENLKSSPVREESFGIIHGCASRDERLRELTNTIGS